MDTIVLSANQLTKAADFLRAGEVVAFPTETVYGLAADARSDTAIAKIFAAKQRPAFNPLIVHLSDVSKLAQYAEIPANAAPLVALWPGPLTMVLPLKTDSGLSNLITAGLKTVAIRIPQNPLARELLNMFDGPVAAPSANRSGKISATCVEHVLKGLKGRIAAVVDGGACSMGLESTIVGFESDDVVLLRAGGLNLQRIENLTGKPVKFPESGIITAPGQMASHYAPEVQVRINADAPKTGEGWLGFGVAERIAPGINLSSSADLEEAATNLFAALHKMDAICALHGLKGFAVAKIPNTGLGLAINDRLIRASAPR